MENCISCKYLGSEDGIYIRGGEENTNHHRCLKVIHGNGDEWASHDTPAFVADGSGYAASLRVLPTFGCILHERRS